MYCRLVKNISCAGLQILHFFGKKYAARFTACAGAALYILPACLMLFTGCTGLPVKTEPLVDYTDTDSIAREVGAVRQLITDKPLAALVRAKRLEQCCSETAEIQELYTNAKQAVISAFSTAAAAQEWHTALTLFRSLAALHETPAEWTEEQLLQMQQKEWQEKGFAALAAAPDKTSGDAASIQIMQTLIQGVVTVWVDRGITIEKGLGRADRMIGSGFFIDSSGYLITNYHVIQSEVDPSYEGFSRVYIKQAGNSAVRIPAKVVGWDPVFDLALLKVEITPEVYFQLGSSKDLVIGSKIYAMGSPAGLDQTLTSGIVSAQNRRLLSLGSVLQIDAPVNHGSSGGPIIDEQGRVQAVVFAGLERQEGLNFAIPVELLKHVLPQLYAGGKVQHAWLGAFGNTADKAAGGVRAGGAADKTDGDSAADAAGGAVLLYALPDGPAAYIPHGSVITHINGIKIETLEDLQTQLMHVTPGTIIELSGVRNTWYVLTEPRPEYPAEQVYRKERIDRAMLPLYGLYLTSTGRRKAFRITDVVRGSSADEAGFTEGDYFEIRTMELHKENSVIYTQIYTKRRKAGYLDAFMGIWAYLDSPSYF
ncbi:MAG: S1C family serine protease [Treponema sp.]